MDELSRAYHLTLVVLLKTWLSLVNADLLWTKQGLDLFCYIEAVGMSRGILVMWNVEDALVHHFFSLL